MKKTLFLSVIAVLSLLSFPGCEKENPENENGNNETPENVNGNNGPKGPKVETMSAEKRAIWFVSLTGRVSGLEDEALDFECGIEYSTDTCFAEYKTTRIKAVKVNKYSEAPYNVTFAGVSLDQKYYYRAYCINKLKIYYGAVKDFVFTWEIPQVVDLGLSIRWASWNVGASCPWEFGEYYAWGETETKSNYDWSTYKWCNGSYDTQIKYCARNGYGSLDNKTTLDPEDDVVHVKWGGSWRMPTRRELNELHVYCNWRWITLNGVKGYLVTSSKAGYTDCSIFLPAAGGRFGTDLDKVGNNCYFWSSSLGEMPFDGGAIISSPNLVDTNAGSYRCFGFSVRPVCP